MSLNATATSNLKALIPTQLHPPLERRQLHYPRRSVGNSKKRIPRLRMQIHILLHRPTLAAVVGEVAALSFPAADLPKHGPGLELPDQSTFHRPDVRHRELIQCLT